MGHASSALQVLDFATDFVPVVNLVKNTTLAIYDAATGDIDGVKQRAIQMFASAISTATLGAGDEFVVMADSIIFGPEVMGAVESALSRLSLTPSVQASIMEKVAGQIGASPITAASKIIQWISSEVYDKGTKHEAKVAILKALHVQEEHTAEIPEDGFRWHWSKQPGVAMYAEADWGEWHSEKDIDLAEAVKIAMSNGYKGFFYCNELTKLPKYGSFEKHSAVFFHDEIATSPWLGSAPHCDYFKCENEIKSGRRGGFVPPVAM